MGRGRLATSHVVAGQLLIDWWRAPAVTGERIQFCVYSPVEQTCCRYVINLLYVHPKEYTETELYLILVLGQVI